MNKRKIHEDYIKAGAEATSVEDLRNLSASENLAVRIRVAENERTPPEALSVLAKDESADVRQAVALNKAADPSIVNRLACDDHPDVRHRLAATSYVPRHLLQQLADDENPYVAHRAKTTLSRLDCKAGRMATVFEFLAADHALLAGKLNKLLESFSALSLDQKFEQTVDVMDGIRQHFERQRSLCLDWIEHHAPDSMSLEQCLKQSTADHAQMLDKLSDLLMQHVDGPDFEEGLRDLLEQIQKHVNFSENELFAEIKKHFSVEELETMNLNLNKALLQRQCA